MKRRIISMLLVFCIILSSMPIEILAVSTQNTKILTKSETTKNPFSDVKESNWFYESVMYALENELFKGTSNTSFSPEGTMTRAMYVTVMGRIAEINPDDYKGNQDFSDVPVDSWYAPYVTWAKSKGIISGVGNGNFNPDGLITREQMAVLVVRFFDSYKIPYPAATVTNIPADLEKVSDYAVEAVLKLWSCGIFKGNENGNFNPKNNATRAEAAVICKFTDEIVEKWFVDIGKKPVIEEQKPEEQPKDKPKEKPSKGGGSSDPGSGKESYTVTFMDGNRQVESFTVEAGKPLSKTPSNTKTAKDGSIFVGWFTDKECTVPFYAEDPVNSNLLVYAKYENIVKEELTIDSFSLLDQSPNLSFEIQRISDNGADIKNSIVLTVMDGTDPVELNIIDNGNDTYTVKARDGFCEGSSYKLTLGDGYIFKNKAESIRTANFSIAKEEVYNLALNDDIIYIKDTAELKYKIGNNDPVDVLKPELLNNENTEEVTGSFEYENASELEKNDIICIYEKTPPYERDYVNNTYADDAEVYVEVININGNTVTFRGLDASDAEKVIFMPDTIPFKVAELPNGESGIVKATEVDNKARVAMGLNENPEVEKGDFLVFYVGEFSALTEESEVYYAVVTNVNGDTVSYQKTTKEEIEKSMDTFLQQTPDGNELLEGVDVQDLTDKIEQQVLASGFAEDAAEYLALMATQTKGFQDLSGLTDFSMTGENGNSLTAEDLQLMGIGKNIELSDDVEVKVELDKSSKYFKNGIRLAVGIGAEFSVDVGDGGELKIVLSATFVEEISIDITASAHAKIKWIVVVPKFKELTFSSSVDIKNYSAISVDVKMYTVEKEEEGLWEKLKGIKNGKYKKTFEEIEELKDKITEAKGTAEEIQGYIEDLEKLWAAVPSDVTNKTEYEELLDTLGELNVTQELTEMLNLTSETELDAGIRNLMDRYSEMLENESDWIEILNKEIFRQQYYISVFAFRISADFVIKANVNIAMGANMEYVVGKRYSFWFDIISKTSGSSEMDLLDEKFAFQFYVMGKLGLKMGVEAEIAVGVISTKIGSIGLTAEFGPYVETWGYFIYEYTKLRPANTSTWDYDETMMGALYLEFGLYLEMTFKAQALDELFKYEPTLLDKKWPLLTAGTRNNVYDFAYEIEDDEVLLVKDYDNNSANGITMILPEVYRQMEYIDLCEGNVEQEIYDLSKFNYTLSNRNFTINKDTGEISVTVPDGVQYMECDLTLTWKLDKLAFSNYDITVTIPLVWTNLSTEELNERFTASVLVGNAQDGYTTVWSKRVMKNSGFDLPTEEEIKVILGVDSYESAYGNLKYSAIDGYKGQQTEGLTILRDESYYFEVTPRTYILTVKVVEKSDGTKEDKEFIAKFGETFDFRSLATSGTNDDENRNYTAFLKVVAKDNKDKEILRDINAPIGRAFALDILGGATYTATYVDNSATVKFQFEGVDLDPIEVKMKKGDVASSKFFNKKLDDMNAMVVNISPIFAPITGPITYTVICEVQKAPLAKHTITYITNGGSEIQPDSYTVGSVITKPTDPTRQGYTFEGWYSEPDMTQEFTFDIMPDKDITLYAKWRGEEYTVTLDANEGTLPQGVEKTMKVIFGQNYGELPTPTKTGSSFKGWFTERIGGQRITEDTLVDVSKDHVLYAQWGKKATIDENIIVFEPNQVYDYNGEHHEVAFKIEGDIDPSSFIVKYKRQNLDSSWSDKAINAGKYDVKIVRDEDESYDYFEKTFTNVMFVNKIAREINANPKGSSYYANLLVDKIPQDAYPGDGTLVYAVSTTNSAIGLNWQESRVFSNMAPG